MGGFLAAFGAAVTTSCSPGGAVFGYIKSISLDGGCYKCYKYYNYYKVIQKYKEGYILDATLDSWMEDFHRSGLLDGHGFLLACPFFFWFSTNICSLCSFWCCFACSPARNGRELQVFRGNGVTMPFSDNPEPGNSVALALCDINDGLSKGCHHAEKGVFSFLLAALQESGILISDEALMADLTSRQVIGAIEKERKRLQAIADKHALASSEPYCHDDVVTYRIAFRSLRGIGVSACALAALLLFVAGGLEVLRPLGDVSVTTQNGLVVKLPPGQISD